VSRWQRNIDWQQVSLDSLNIRFAIIRASYGGMTDPHYHRNSRGCTQNYIVNAAYHYFNPTVPVEEQVDTFLSQIRDSNPRFIALDIEAHHHDLPELVRQWLEQVSNQTGKKILLYINANYYWHYFWYRPYFWQYDLWVYDLYACPNLRFSIWQYSHSGRVRGIVGAVDLNRLKKKSALYHEMNLIFINHIPDKY
jgi:lysozyme